MLPLLFIDVNKWRIHNQGLNWEIISFNNTHHREALLIILDSKVLSGSLTSVSALWAAHFHVIKKDAYIKKNTGNKKYIRFIPAPQQQRFPVNDCRLDYLVSLHKNLMLTNDAVLSRWFIYGRRTVPIVGTAQWLDALTHLQHLASQLSHSFCHCSSEAAPPVFNNIQ